jgi:hypothetical protein
MTPKSIGHYEILELLGSGGIGHVYAALDQDLGRTVAIKALRPEFSGDPSFVERFRAEAGSLARLNHPNITTLFSLHRQEQELFMVMELVRGQTLEALLGRVRRLGARECLAVIAQTAAGLSYAHRMGVIHRDIKPSNLMLTDSGLLKIMDFGIARVRGSQRLTREGSIVGTLAYVAPEQVKGGEGDERSDLYSLACVLYEMLSGGPPFHSDSEYELLRAQVETRPDPLSVRPKDLDPKVERVLMRALAKNPTERFASLDEFSLELGAAAVQGEAADILRNSLLTSVMRPAETRLIMQPDASGAGERGANAAGASNRASGIVATGDTHKSKRPVGMILAGVIAVLALGLGFAGYVALSGSGAVGVSSQVADAAKPLAPRAPVVSQAQSPSPAKVPHAASETVPRQAETAPPSSPFVATAAAPAPSVPAAPAAASAANILPLPPTIAPAAVSSSLGRPRLPQQIKGIVASYSADGWPIIDGQTARLAGVEMIAADKIARVSSWIKAHGDFLECEAVDETAYRCLTQQKLDVSQAVLLNGAARASPAAGPIYREAEERAQAARRGVWQ